MMKTWDENGGKKKRSMDLVGAGMGTQMTMTKEALEALEKAQVIFGAKRILSASLSFSVPKVPAYLPAEILDYLNKNRDVVRAAVLFSGDTGFFSGAGKVYASCKAEFQVTIYPGISTAAYFAAKLGIPWEDFHLCSLHGREYNLVGALLRYSKVFVLFADGAQLRDRVAELEYYGLSQVQAAVGTDLGMHENTRHEHVIPFSPLSRYRDFHADGLHVAVFYNPQAGLLPVTYGLSDSLFFKDKVPMTKEEVRCVSLSKLGLREDSIVYDIGAGCGSVGIECARIAWKGRIYAFEKDENAILCLKRNARKFQAANLTIQKGEASELLRTSGLPVPTHAFIGGTGGRMQEILDLLLDKNPYIQIVANAVTLESLRQLMEYANARKLNAQYVQIAAARANPMGNYHLMQAQNPVMVVTLRQHYKELQNHE